MPHSVQKTASLIAVAAIAAIGVVSGNHHASASSGLRVLGNQLVDSGVPVVLHGVNRSGTEYPCIQGWGVADGPLDAASVAAMAAWHVNAVRIPLNEDCWLGINGAGVGGATYQQAIGAYVNLLTQSGMAAIVDLHWSAPGATQSTGQQPMADEDHAPAFWTSVATAFKGNTDVIFDLFNEPYPQNNQSNAATWACWRDGCSETSQQGAVYQAAGMQQLVTTVRATGAGNVILLDGIQWGGTINSWAQYRPSDPLNNLAAGQHSYPFSACASSACWDSTTAPLAQQYPVIMGEVGQTDCKADYISTFLPWLDQHGVSYFGWTWSPSFGCESLLTNYQGAPSSPYGQTFKDYLAGLAANNSPSPTGTATPAATATSTSSATATATATPSATLTPSATSTNTPTAPPTATATATATPTARAVLSLQPFVNNIGISSDSNPAAANFDGSSYSYSATALAAVGLSAGRTVTAGGSTFTWPSAPPGALDDVQSQGQLLRFQAPPPATRLAFLGAAAHGPSYGTATITYSDGSVQRVTLGMSDWTLNGNQAQPSLGNSIAATAAYRNYTGVQSSVRRTYVFYAYVTLHAGKTVASLQLPSTVNQGRLAIFAVALS